MEQFLILNGLQIFTERYPRNEVPDDWDVPKKYSHSVIGCKMIVLKHITTNTQAESHYSIDMWFDESPVVTLTLYNNNRHPIIEQAVVFADYKYDTMIDAMEILMGTFSMCLNEENFEVVY